MESVLTLVLMLMYELTRVCLVCISENETLSRDTSPWRKRGIDRKQGEDWKKQWFEEKKSTKSQDIVQMFNTSHPARKKENKASK